MVSRDAFHTILSGTEIPLRIHQLLHVLVYRSLRPEQIDPGFPFVCCGLSILLYAWICLPGIQDVSAMMTTFVCGMLSPVSPHVFPEVGALREYNGLLLVRNRFLYEPVKLKSPQSSRRTHAAVIFAPFVRGEAFVFPPTGHRTLPLINDILRS